jgi:hypothetical protein
MKARLQKMGFQSYKQWIRGDGQCLPDSLAFIEMIVENHQDRVTPAKTRKKWSSLRECMASRMRKSIVNWLREMHVQEAESGSENPINNFTFEGKEKSWEDYMEKMSEPSTYMDGACIRAAIELVIKPKSIISKFQVLRSGDLKELQTWRREADATNARSLEVLIIHENGNHIYPCIAGIRGYEEEGKALQTSQNESKAIDEGEGADEFAAKIKLLKQEAEKEIISSVWLGEAWAKPFMENYFDRLAQKLVYSNKGMEQPLEIVKRGYKGLSTATFQKGTALTGGRDKLIFYFDTKQDYQNAVEKLGDVPRQCRIAPVIPRVRMAEIETQFCWKDSDLDVLRIKYLPLKIGTKFTSDIIRQAFSPESLIAPLEVRATMGITKIYLYRRAHRDSIKSVLQNLVVEGKHLFKPSMFLAEGEQEIKPQRQHCNLCADEEVGHRTEECPKFFWIFVEFKKCWNLGSLVNLGTSLGASRVIMAGSIVAPLPWNSIQLGKKAFFIYERSELTSLRSIQRIYEGWARKGYSLRGDLQNVFINLEKNRQGWIKTLTDLFEEINKDAKGTGSAPPRSRGTGMLVCFDKFDRGVCLKDKCQSLECSPRSGPGGRGHQEKKVEPVCLDFRRPRFGCKLGQCRFGQDCFFAHANERQKDQRELKEVRKKFNMCPRMMNPKGQYRLCREETCNEKHNPWQEGSKTVVGQRIKNQLEQMGFKENGGPEECVFENKTTKLDIVIASKYERVLFDSAGGAVVELAEANINPEVKERLEPERLLAGEQEYFTQFRYSDAKRGDGTSFTLLQQKKKFDTVKRDFKIFIPIGGAKTVLDCRPGMWYLLPQIWNFRTRKRGIGPSEAALPC